MAKIDKNVYNLIVEESKKRGWGMPAAIYAHHINESGWPGKQSSLWTKYNNGWGMKCGGSWLGKSVNMATKEEYSVGVLTSIRDNFRVYDSIEAGVKGVFDFLEYSRYKAVRDAKTDEEFIHQLKECGWWTSSTAEANIIKILQEVRKQVADTDTVEIKEEKKEEIKVEKQEPIISEEEHTPLDVKEYELLKAKDYINKALDIFYKYM